MIVATAVVDRELRHEETVATAVADRELRHVEVVVTAVFRQ